MKKSNYTVAQLESFLSEVLTAFYSVSPVASSNVVRRVDDLAQWKADYDARKEEADRAFIQKRYELSMSGYKKLTPAERDALEVDKPVKPRI